MNYLFVLAAGAGLWYFFGRGEVSVETLSDVMKKVTVDGRAYLVTRLGGGLFNVTSTTSPQDSITFDQAGEKAALGNAVQVRSDMQRFPNDLFKST